MPIDHLFLILFQSVPHSGKREQSSIPAATSLSTLSVSRWLFSNLNAKNAPANAVASVPITFAISSSVIMQSIDNFQRSSHLIYQSLCSIRRLLRNLNRLFASCLHVTGLISPPTGQALADKLLRPSATSFAVAVSMSVCSLSWKALRGRPAGMSGRNSRTMVPG
jgi:hypothetical protein